MTEKDILVEERTQLIAERDCLLRMMGDKIINDGGDFLGNDNPISMELDAIAVKLKVLEEKLKELEDA